MFHTLGVFSFGKYIPFFLKHIELGCPEAFQLIKSITFIQKPNSLQRTVALQLSAIRRLERDVLLYSQRNLPSICLVRFARPSSWSFLPN